MKTRQNECGAAAGECALVAPLLLRRTRGIAEFGRADHVRAITPTEVTGPTFAATLNAFDFSLGAPKLGTSVLGLTNEEASMIRRLIAAVAAMLLVSLGMVLLLSCVGGADLRAMAGMETGKVLAVEKRMPERTSAELFILLLGPAVPDIIRTFR